MGQSASLYIVDRTEFSKIGDDPEFPVSTIARESSSFDKSYEGLIFLISKGSTPEQEELVRQIFYAKEHIGEEIDFNNLDFDELPEDFDFDKQPIYYNDPQTVSDIADLLAGIEPNTIIALFDASELNEEDIYPGQVWSDEVKEGTAFHPQHMAEELLMLKSIYAKAQELGAYVVSYVG